MKFKAKIWCEQLNNKQTMLKRTTKKRQHNSQHRSKAQIQTKKLKMKLNAAIENLNKKLIKYRFFMIILIPPGRNLVTFNR